MKVVYKGLDVSPNRENSDTNTNPKVTNKYWYLNLTEHFETFFFFQNGVCILFLKILGLVA